MLKWLSEPVMALYIEWTINYASTYNCAHNLLIFSATSKGLHYKMFLKVLNCLSAVILLTKICSSFLPLNICIKYFFLLSSWQQNSQKSFLHNSSIKCQIKTDSIIQIPWHVKSFLTCCVIYVLLQEFKYFFSMKIFAKITLNWLIGLI